MRHREFSTSPLHGDGVIGDINHFGDDAIIDDPDQVSDTGRSVRAMATYRDADEACVRPNVQRQDQLKSTGDRKLL